MHLARSAAVGANAIAYLIPCHRVIRETGVFGHYKWDPMRKRAMVGWEHAQGIDVRREVLAQASGF